MKKAVLDSWALLALLQGEAPGRKVKYLIDRASRGEIELLMCEVNFGEVVYILKRRHAVDDLNKWLPYIEALPIRFVPADRELVLAASELKAKYPIAFADCMAAALALLEDAEVVTGDPEFELLSEEVNIQWLVSQRKA